MTKRHNKSFPNETSDYRVARNKLLEAEIALRAQVEEVAKLRRELPLGNELKENYAFEEINKKINFEDLFDEGKDTLILYTFMYGTSWEKPCPMCTSILDGYNGSARHINDRVSFAIIGEAPAEKLQKFASNRGWNNLRLVSANSNTFLKDYHSQYESNWGELHPLIHVFKKKEGKVFHFWTSEMQYTWDEAFPQPRHADMTWPLWNLFDLTPEGRGEEWYPKLQY